MAAKRTAMDCELPTPLLHMGVGDSRQVAGFAVTRHPASYECSCSEWTLQKGTPWNSRTCAHITTLLGSSYESARLKWAAQLLSQIPDDLKKPKRNEQKALGKAVFPAPIKHDEPPLLLSQKYTDSINIDGYWLSEKLDGVRGYYDHKLRVIISRLGNEFPCPEWFLKGFPTDFSLDGEFFISRHMFQETISIVKDPLSPDWSKIKFYVFDSPSLSEIFEQRREKIADYFSKTPCPTVTVVTHTKISTKEDLHSLLKSYEALGSDGVMLRKPKSYYVAKRSSTLLKVKSFYDAEALVIEHIPGKGKYMNLLGALHCKMANGVTFKIGTGYSDSTRVNPPPVGSIVSYRFQELSSEGKPVFPAFVGERSDLNTARDAVIKSRGGKKDEDE